MHIVFLMGYTRSEIWRDWF